MKKALSLGRIVGLAALTFAASALPALPAGAWNAPVGIPVPSWPSDLDLARPALPATWSAEQTGFYFVSATGCSDARVYGYPAAPRCTIPTSPAAGSVIALSGTYTRTHTLSFNGTAANPIWILGFSASDKPIVTSYWDIPGSYVIVDSVDFRLTTRDGVTLSGNHIMVRNSSMANPYGTANGAGFALGGQHIIYYKNVVSQMGDWLYTGPDIDRQGIKVYGGSDIWILDSTFYHCQSDGVQIGDATNTAAQIQRVYVGRNTAYENLQFGFWTKNATDVIFSSNLIYNQTRVTASGSGGGVGGQYDPKYVWFINNVVYNSNSGVHIAGSNNGGGGPWYAIGNLLYSIGSGSCNAYDFGAIAYRNDGGFTAIFNTVHDSDFFVGFPPAGGTVTVRNNIFSQKRSAGCNGFVTERAVAHNFNLFTNAADDPNAEANRVVTNNVFAAAPTNFSLTPTSPAIGSANQVTEDAFTVFQARYGLDIKRDLRGTARPTGTWDMGAIEYSAGIVPLAPASFLVN
jgi:Right handed beta helix region